MVTQSYIRLIIKTAKKIFSEFEWQGDLIYHIISYYSGGYDKIKKLECTYIFLKMTDPITLIEENEEYIKLKLSAHEANGLFNYEYFYNMNEIKKLKEDINNYIFNDKIPKED